MNFNELPDEKKGGLYFLVKGREGGKNKYSFDGKILKLEDVLPDQLKYPETYGIVVKTLQDDGRPLDGFVLLQESPPAGTLVQARPVGVLRVEKGGRRDDKIICAAVEDSDYSDMEDVEEMVDEQLEGVEDFFETYGYLKGEEVKVKNRFGKEKAEKLLKHTRKLYKRKKE